MSKVYHTSQSNELKCPEEMQELKKTLQRAINSTEHLAVRLDAYFDLMREQRDNDREQRKEDRAAHHLTDEQINEIHDLLQTIVDKDSSLLAYLKEQNKVQAEQTKMKTSVKVAIGTAIISGLVSIILALINLFA